MVNYEANRWKSARWKKNTRYYHCDLKQDLFGNWIVQKHWGDNRSKRGRSMECCCENFEAAEKLFQQVIKRRKYRKYQLVDEY